MMQANQHMNARVNSSVGKTSSKGGENSFEKKVSKTPKAPGTVIYGQINTDSEFISNSSTADKANYSTSGATSNPNQAQIQRAQSRQRSNQRQITVVNRNDSSVMNNQSQIDQKIVQVQYPGGGGNTA